MPPAIRSALLVAFALTLLVTGCSGGGDDDAKKDDTETSSAEFAKAAVELDLSRAELVSPHQALGPLDTGTSDAVVGVVQKLLLITSAGPLVEGKALGGFADLFAPDAGLKAANRDRAVWFDENLPLFGELAQDEARVGLTALAGSNDAAPALVVAKYVWEVHSVLHPSNSVRRTGEVLLTPKKGVWTIGAYTIVVERTIDDETTTTTATTETTEKGS